MPLNPKASAFNPGAPVFAPNTGNSPDYFDGVASFPTLGVQTAQAPVPTPGGRGAWGAGAPKGAWGSGQPAIAAEVEKGCGVEPAKATEVVTLSQAAETRSGQAVERSMQEADGVHDIDGPPKDRGAEAGEPHPKSDPLQPVPSTLHTDSRVGDTGVSEAVVSEQGKVTQNLLFESAEVDTKAREDDDDMETNKVRWHQDLQPPPAAARSKSDHAKDVSAARLQPKIQRETSVAPPNQSVGAAILRWESVEDLHAAAAMAMSIQAQEAAFDALPSVVTWLLPGGGTRQRPTEAPSPGRGLTLDIPERGVVHNPKLEDFEILRLVGRGGFGKVYQVRKKKSGRIMALKAMRKHLIVEELNVEGTHNERSVLESIQHPFVIRLHCAFHDHGRLYLLMDWHNGGHLLKLLHEHAPFMEKEVRFYLAELVLAIEGLHSHGIVHRDLKPENVLIDAMGHLIVTDFGASKISSKANEDIRTNSWVGTVLYMAPEQLQGKVYGRVVDWWAVGLLAWEMLTGDNPFYHENPDQIAARVQKKKLNLPSHLHGDTHSMLKAMLNRDPEKRLGKKGTAEVKDHAFFAKAKAFSWKDSFEKKRPGLHENPDDVSQVDDVYTSLPAVMSPVDPSLLSPTAQEQFQGFEWVSPLYSPAVNRMPVPDIAPAHLDLSAPADAIPEDASVTSEPPAAKSQAAEAAIQNVANALGHNHASVDSDPSDTTAPTSSGANGNDIQDKPGDETCAAEAAPLDDTKSSQDAPGPPNAWGRPIKIASDPAAKADEEPR